MRSLAKTLAWALTAVAPALWAAVPEEAVYQWATEVRGVVSKETADAPRAYLWLPPATKTVRGVVFAMHNMLEEPVLAHPAFRAKLAQADVGICWVTPMIPQAWDRLTESELRAIEALMTALATLSGHAELATAPLAPFGHSALATFPYLFAAARPERTFCAVSIKGDWPTAGRPCWEPAQQAARAQVPLLLVSGEYEDGYGRREKSRDLMAAVPGATFSMWVDVGGGHFDWSDELCRDLGIWFAAMAQAPRHPKGVMRGGFWYPSARLAKLVEDYERLPRGRGEFTVLGYEVGGEVVKQNPQAHLQVVFSTREMTFAVRPVFEKTVPPGRPEGWTGRAAGAENPAPGAPAAPVLQKIQGPVEHLGGDRWAVRYNRYDPRGRRAREASLQMVYPGDGAFKRSVQQGLVRIPPPRTSFRTGAERRVALGEFAPAIPAGHGAYVREGPARIADGRVVLADVPQFGKLPPVVLVTYDLARTQDPVVTTFVLTRDGTGAATSR
ncbi:MAG: hypothetical protein ACI4RD_05425 [Kiritimatiellia bacterium]